MLAWDLSGQRHFAPVPFDAGVPGPVTTRLAVAADGARFAVKDSHGYVNVYDSRTLKRVRRLKVGIPEPVDIASAVIAMSPDGRTVAVTGLDGLGLWDVRRGRRVAMPAGPEPAPFSPTFGDHGHWLVAMLGEHEVAVWDLRTHDQVAKRHLKGVPLSFTASANTGLVAANIGHEHDTGGEVDILSLPGLKTVARLTVPSGVVAGFSPRTGSCSRSATAVASRACSTPAPGSVVGASWPGTRRADPDDDLQPGRALARDLGLGRDRAALGGRLPTPRSAPRSRASRTTHSALRFVRGGADLLAVSITGRGFLWDLRPEVWMRDACSIAGRVLHPLGVGGCPAAARIRAGLPLSERARLAHTPSPDDGRSK